jgi:hypothetical protein
MDTFMEKVMSENRDLFPAVYEWIGDGWGLEGRVFPEQIAAALLMEANTQDQCVRDGDSDQSYPIRLRELAYNILFNYHPVPKGLR